MKLHVLFERSWTLAHDIRDEYPGKRIERGVDSLVVIHDDRVTKYVIGQPDVRTNQAIRSFFGFLRYVRANPDNPALPKILRSEIVQRDQDRILVVELEKLDHMNADQKEIAKLLQEYLYNRLSWREVEAKVKEEIAARPAIEPVVKSDDTPVNKLTSGTLRYLHALQLTDKAIREDRKNWKNFYETALNLQSYAEKLPKSKGSWLFDYSLSNIMKRSDGTIVFNDPLYYYEQKRQKNNESIVTEMPLSDYQTVGDFTKTGSFRQPDRRLVSSRVSQIKTVKFFRNTPVNFRLFFSNRPGSGKYREMGRTDSTQIERMFPQDADKILSNTEDAITVVFVSNAGAEHVVMTPWTMAHRIGHAIQSRGRAYSWKEIENHFFLQINNILRDMYNKPIDMTNRMEFSQRSEYNSLFNAIGTQRSSRQNLINRPYEFLYELFAQYLATGKVQLNPLPIRLPYGKKAWGNPTRWLTLNREDRDDQTRKQVTETLALDMEILFNDVLNEATGQVFVM